MTRPIILTGQFFICKHVVSTSQLSGRKKGQNGRISLTSKRKRHDRDPIFKSDSTVLLQTYKIIRALQFGKENVSTISIEHHYTISCLGLGINMCTASFSSVSVVLMNRYFSQLFCFLENPSRLVGFTLYSECASVCLSVCVCS